MDLTKLGLYLPKRMQRTTSLSVQENGFQVIIVDLDTVNKSDILVIVASTTN